MPDESLTPCKALRIFHPEKQSVMNHLLKSIFLLLAASIAPSAQADALTGAWRGELTLGQHKLPLVFNFSEPTTGNTACTIDSPSQGAKGIATNVTFCSQDSIALECAAIGASFSGKISSGSIAGTFSQRGYSFPLNLTPESPLEDRRPQTPKPPFPYNITDTVFTAPDGAVMSATLTMPATATGGKVPAIVMVTGSGPQNRDEEILEHRPFAVIADFLARNGIASLRYDDRGTGRSTGDFHNATTHTFKEDAASGIRFLRTIPGIDNVGVLGHSEGGTIAFMLGAEKAPDFIISLAGMSVPGKETLIMQNGRALDKAGLNGDDKKNTLTLMGIVFDSIAAQHRQGISTPIDVDSICRASGANVPPQIVSSLKMTATTRTPWIDAFIDLDPGEYIGKVKCPMLTINGDKDTQVEASANISIIRKMAPHAETEILPGLNHLMQHCATGDASEYGEIRETIAPEALDAILRFIIKTTQK